MAETRDAREMGTSLMFIGTALWVCDLLVIFFLPAAIKLGNSNTFFSVVAVLALFGLALVVKGYEMRKHASTD